MPEISEFVWSGHFKRVFRKRVLGTAAKRLFEEKVRLFVEDPFDVRLKTHKLSGRLAGLWAFSVDYDCRVIFKFLPGEKVLLVDIGTHSEVY